MMTRFTANVKSAARRFHQNEDGGALEMVMLVAMGAMVMVGMFKIYEGNIKTQVIQRITDLFDVVF